MSRRRRWPGDVGRFLLGQTLADKHRIDERLNEGGMGTVYRGTHVLMDKTVAIKVLRPPSLPTKR